MHHMNDKMMIMYSTNTYCRVKPSQMEKMSVKGGAHEGE